MPHEEAESGGIAPEVSSDHGAASFEDRVVGYVDILGFREIVKDAVNNAATFRTVRDALTVIEAQVNQLQEDRRKCAALD